MSRTKEEEKAHVLRCEKMLLLSHIRHEIESFCRPDGTELGNWARSIVRMQVLEVFKKVSEEKTDEERDIDFFNLNCSSGS